jgi:glyoxylase-like metal-dependent hydrolase (beta-lactamase superfamily II)
METVPEVVYEQVSPHSGLITGEQSFICSDIGIIKGEKETLLVDVGASAKQVQLLSDLLNKGNLKPVLKIILTHFHPDHLKNLSYFPGDEVYASKNTSRYVKVTNLVNENIEIDLGSIHLEVFQIPSIHAKGSLGVYVKEDQIMFVGDALCLKEKDGQLYTNKDISLNTVSTLKKYQIKDFIYGHKGQFASCEQTLKFLDFLKNCCVSSKSTDVFISPETAKKAGFDIYY